MKYALLAMLAAQYRLILVGIGFAMFVYGWWNFRTHWESLTDRAAIFTIFCIFGGAILAWWSV